MTLVDSFVELIAYVACFLKAAPGQPTSFEQVNTDITHLIGKSQELFQKSRLPQDEYDLARFAVFAWIDETILSSDWPEKGKWQGEQLQRVYYQTTDGGELFFDKLNQLGSGQNQVREVYYLCLALGFSGRYCNPGDEFLLEQLTNSNLKLVGGVSEQDLSGQAPLFPDAYLPGGSKKKKSKGNSGLTLGLMAAATAPVLLYGVLFFIYRFVLSNVGENFISSVL